MFAYGDLIFGGMLAAAVVWLLVDLFIIYKKESYTLQQMKLFGVGLISLQQQAWSMFGGLVF